MAVPLNQLKYLAPHANTDDNSTHEYLNMQIVNEYSPNNTDPQPLIFNQTKTSNVVDVAGDYYLSVVRWNIQTNLPVLIPDMDLATPGFVYTGHTIYRVALLFTTNSGGTYNLGSPFPSATVDFIPEVKSQTILSTLTQPSSIEETYNNPFFYLKYVDSFLIMINTAIQDYFLGIAGAIWANLPYFTFDAVAQKIIFHRPNSIPQNVPGTDATTQWYLAVNQPLYNLLSTFKFDYYPFGSNANYPQTTCNYVLNTDILGSYQTGTGSYDELYQQAPSVVNWQPAQSLVFVSSAIPVEVQYSGAPFNLNKRDASTQSTIFQQQSTIKTLTDFLIPYNTGTETAAGQQIYYLPTAEYRLIDLLGNSPINQLNIQVLWRDKYGVYHQFFLEAGAAADILIMLRKKNYNKASS